MLNDGEMSLLVTDVGKDWWRKVRMSSRRKSLPEEEEKSEVSEMSLRPT